MFPGRLLYLEVRYCRVLFFLGGWVRAPSICWGLFVVHAFPGSNVPIVLNHVERELFVSYFTS